MRRAAPTLATVGLGVFVAGSWALRFVGAGRFPAIDSLLYFLPLYEATYARLAAGRLPLWNPYQLCGEPWLGSLQAGTFYPPHVLYLVLPLATAHAASGVLHLVLAALGTLAFCRRAGLGTAAGVLAAAVFALRGRMTFSLIQPNFLEAATWLPLGALGVLEIVEGSRRRGAALVAVATGLSLLAGYPQPTVYLAYAWGLLLVALLLGARAGAGRWGAASAAFAGAGVLGALAAAVQLLPAAELAAVGTRSADGLDADTIGAMSILTPATVILGTGAVAGGPHAYGVVALALAAASIASARRRSLALWALVLAVLSALLALAGWGPLYGLYLALPGIGWFRYPHRILVLTDFAVAIGAAVGLDALVRQGSAGARRAAAAVAGAALVALVVLAERGWAPDTERVAVRVAAGAAAAALGGAALVRRGRGGAVAAAVVVALALGEISRTGWHGVRLPYGGDDVAPYDQAADAWRALATRTGGARAWIHHVGIMPAFAVKLATRHRLRVVEDYEPVNTRRQAEYFRYLTEASTRATRQPWLFQGGVGSLEPPPGVAPPATRRRLLDLAALRFFAHPAGRRLPAADAAFVRDAGFVPAPAAAPGLEVYENPHALPRAFVTYRTRAAPPPEALLAALARGDFDPLAESYVEAGPALGTTGAPRGHAATIVRDEETVVEVEATLAADGLVVLADAFHPGWRATVDGAPAPIVPTNHLFRGVPVPAGTHRVRFAYRPWSVVLGAAASGLGVLAIAVLGRAGRRRAGPASPPPTASARGSRGRGG